jgi:DNA primase
MTQFPYSYILDIANQYDEAILKELDLPVRRNGNVVCACPIHDGDNPHGFSYSTKHKKWQCFTHRCHEKYGSNLFGLVRGLKQCSLREAADELVFILKIETDVDLDTIEAKAYAVKKIKEKVKLEKFNPNNHPDIHLGAKYFSEKRGVPNETILSYYPYICIDRKSGLYGRACLSIKNEDGDIVGYTGRKTDLIDRYDHNKYVPKWFHYPNYVGRECLFGIDRVRKTDTVFLLEGCIGVLKLQSVGINNAICTFGNKITANQRKILLKLGIRNIITLFDPDEGGRIGAALVNKNCSLYFNIMNFEEKLKKDPGHMVPSELQELKELLNQYVQN